MKAGIDPLDKHLEYRREDLRLGSSKVLKLHIARAQEYFKDSNVKQINDEALRDFVCAQKDLASKTRHELLSALHCFFRWLVDRGEIQESHMPKFPKVKVTMKLRKTIDKATQVEILNEVKRIAARNLRVHFARFWLATYSNVWPGELLKILEEDIDRSRGIVLIRHHKTEKTNDAKYITLIPEDIEAMKQFPPSFPNCHSSGWKRGLGGKAGQSIWDGTSL